MIFVFFVVALLSSIVGSICGIGGGIIIKPVLDAFGLMSVSSISFLSSCTVLSMAIISVIKSFKNSSVKIDFKISSKLAFGAALGGIIGKSLFEYIKVCVGNDNIVGFIQSVVLIIITLFTLIYTINKNKINTYKFKNAFICIIIGIFLGLISVFLGIGGGPINLVILTFFFSFNTKNSAINSIFIILFSQITSLMQTIIGNTIPDIDIMFLIVMVIGGVLGGNIGSRINKFISDDNVNKLFIILMIVIILININNAYKFLC